MSILSAEGSNLVGFFLRGLVNLKNASLCNINLTILLCFFFFFVVPFGCEKHQNANVARLRKVKPIKNQSTIDC